jgi:hypothetical protein
VRETLDKSRVLLKMAAQLWSARRQLRMPLSLPALGLLCATQSLARLAKASPEMRTIGTTADWIE